MARSILLLTSLTISKNFHVEKIIQKPLFIPETTSLSMQLNQFRQSSTQMALVVDEYGGTQGIITLEDTIETLLGVEIVDEYDEVKDMRKLARELWKKRRKD